jgi:predicted phosphodiesterase
MRIAVLSDIHSNLEALLRVLERAREEKVQAFVCLGDTVGYGPFPNECVEIVRKKCEFAICGNHDAGATATSPPLAFNEEGRAAIEWTRTQLSPENLAFLKELPLARVAYDITFVHASPHKPQSWEYIVTWRDARLMFDYFPTGMCAIGHTHIPAIVPAEGNMNSFIPGQRHLINPGSVGQPRDGIPAASFAIIDTDVPSVRIIRVKYDTSITANAIRKAGLPEFLARRLGMGI